MARLLRFGVAVGAEAFATSAVTVWAGLSNHDHNLQQQRDEIQGLL
jgi:hypothetical protein